MFSHSALQVFFEGVVGSGATGYIAIDDVQIRTGWCSCESKYLFD